MQSLEAGSLFTLLLERLIPPTKRDWVGADESLIASLEATTQVTFPPFYRWFLSTMGKNMGSISLNGTDLSIETLQLLLERRLEQKTEDINASLLPIGTQTIGISETRLLCLDLSQRLRDDALFCAVHQESFEARTNRFETFREMLSWNLATGFGIVDRPVSLIGSLYFEQSNSNPIDKLRKILSLAGLSDLLCAGDHCLIWEDQSTIFTGFSPISFESDDAYYFELGSDDQAKLEEIIAIFSAETSFELELEESK